MRNKARTSIELAGHRVPGENPDTKFCRSGCACKSFRMLKKLCSESTASMRWENNEVCHQSIGPGWIVQVRKRFGGENRYKADDGPILLGDKHLSIGLVT